MSAESLKILMLSYEYPPIGGGGSQVVEGLCKELARTGDEVDLVTMRYGDLPAEEDHGHLRIHRLPCVRRKKFHCTTPEVATYLAVALGKATSLAARVKPDLVHAHFIFPDGLVAWRAAGEVGVPFVITAHGTDVPGYNPHRVQIAHKLLGPLWRQVTRRAAEIICPSDTLKELVLEHAPQATVSVLPNGLEPSRFHDRPKERRILAVTRMLERKGIQYLMQALQDLDLDWQVDVVGDGPYLPELRKMAETSKTPVKFWGWVDNASDELRRLYESSAIFLLPSESENFPICLLEAMAARNAIITSRGTGCEDVVGETGWLVDPHDAAGIKEAVVALTGDEARRTALGQAARRRLEESFSWAAVAGRYREIYSRHVEARLVAAP